MQGSRCVAEHMGGERCIGRCLTPRDCSETPQDIGRWRPIETAPIPQFDAERWYMINFRCLIALKGNSYTTIGNYGYTEKGRGRWKDTFDRVCEPSHWMPLPAPPLARPL